MCHPILDGSLEYWMARLKTEMPPAQKSTAATGRSRKSANAAAAEATLAQPPGVFTRFTKEIGLCLALAAAVWLVFQQIGAHLYVNFDDWDYVGENFAVLNGLSWEGVKFAFTSKISANWHPVTWLSHMLDASLFGENPGAMHAMSMWIHAANAILLFTLLRYLTGAVWRSAAVAALFALHPLHVEPVAWLADRKDLLATFFWLLTALTYGHWVKARAGWGWLAAAHGWAALALMSKPTAVALPLTLLLLDIWPLQRLEEIGQRVREKAGFFALAAVQALVTFQIQNELGATEALAAVDPWRKLANAIASYGIYLFQTVAPVNLTPMYPFPEQVEWFPVLASIAIIVLATMLSWRWRAAAPWFMAGWFWYVLVLAPMAGFVQVGIQAHADRYTYMSLIGIFWIAVWGLGHGLGQERWRRGEWHAAAGVVLALLAWRSYAQAALWVDDQTLFGHTLAVTGKNRLANNVMGLSYLRAKDLDKADKHLRAALEIDRTFMPSYRYLAEVRFAQGKTEEALTLLNRAVEMEPRGTISYYNRGLVLRAMKRPADAAADLEKALKMGLEPDQAKRAHVELGLVRSGENNPAAAKKQFEEALEIDPFYYLAEKNLAFAHYTLKDYARAQFHLKNLAVRDPEDKDVERALKSIRTQQSQ